MRKRKLVKWPDSPDLCKFGRFQRASNREIASKLFHFGFRRVLRSEDVMDTCSQLLNPNFGRWVVIKKAESPSSKDFRPNLAPFLQRCDSNHLERHVVP